MAASPYISDFNQTLSEYGLSQSKLWPAETLCITIAGANTAKTAILKFPSCFPDSVVGFRPYDEVSDLYFVKYALDLMKERFLSISRGATQDNLSLDKMLSFSVNAPRFETQQRIGEIIRAYDDLIYVQNRQISVLLDVARSMHDAFCNGSLGQAAPGPVMHSRFWRFVTENVAPYAGTKRYYATADIEGLCAVGPGLDYTFDRKPSRAQKQPLPYTVWFARMKAAHKIAWYSDVNSTLAEASLLSSGFAGFAASEPAFFAVLFLTVSSEDFQAQKDLYSTGATQMSLTNEGLARITVAIPNESAARDLGRLATPVLDEVLTLQLSVDNLRRTRDLIAPRLVTGEITVDLAKRSLEDAA
jgi:type I restriction enzyme, S subunit